MAETTVTTNGGKYKHAMNSKEHDIVEASTGIGDGTYYACGKCGAALNVWKRDQDTRDAMSDALEKSVFNPLGLLAGLMANVKEEDDSEAGLSVVGYLLGLVVTGARKELEIQKMGGPGAYWLSQLIEGYRKENGGAA